MATTRETLFTFPKPLLNLLSRLINSRPEGSVRREGGEFTLI